jgi:hypothetical protein
VSTKLLALTKYRWRQNIGVNKIRASTKSWPRKNLGVNKELAQTKRWLRRRRIPLLFASAKSIAADFSQAQLKISYISLMVLLSLHVVVKCGVASSHLAFMDGLSPAAMGIRTGGTAGRRPLAPTPHFSSQRPQR